MRCSRRERSSSASKTSEKCRRLKSPVSASVRAASRRRSSAPTSSGRVAHDPLDDQPVAIRRGMPPPQIQRVTPSSPISRQRTSLISPRR